MRRSRVLLISLLALAYALGLATTAPTASADPKKEPEVCQPCPGLILAQTEIDAFCQEKTPPQPSPGERSKFQKGPQP